MFEGFKVWVQFLNDLAAVADDFVAWVKANNEVGARVRRVVIAICKEIVKQLEEVPTE